jgi:hypothetical protein
MVIVFEAFARWVREREIHQKTIKNETRIHPQIDVKSMQILCSKNDAKNMENQPKRRPKGSHKPSTINLTRTPMIGSQKTALGEARVFPGWAGLAFRRGPPW